MDGQYYRELVESALDIIYRADPKGFFTFVNESASTITGFPREELIGMHYSDIIREDYREIVRSFYLQQMLDGKENTYLEMPIVRKDGEERWVAQKVRLIVEEGEIKEAIAVSRDVTERKQAEKELREAKKVAESAQQTEKAFLLRMSHEIRTPMNAIVGMTHLLYDTPLNDRQREYLESIQYATDLLTSLITDVLHLGRIHAGEMVIQQESFLLTGLVEAVCKMIGFKTAKKSIEINHHIDPALPERVWGGKLALNQILVNLLGNAIKFTEEGEVGVEAALVKQNGDAIVVEFRVYDSGIGIDEQYQESIFNDFRQGGKDIHSRYGGSGLGLSIVRELLELMNGSIRVESNPGRGSVFVARLPLEVAASVEESGDRLAESRGEQVPWKNRRVLLVEDNPFNQVYAKELLDGWGIQVEMAEDGEEAISACQDQSFDLILMDVQMPRMNGHEATMHLRSMKDNPNHGIPIVALSAGALLEEKQRAREAGMNDYLTKPFTPKQLQGKLSKWLGTPPKPSSDPEPIANFTPDPRLDQHLLSELYGEDLAYMLEMFDIFEAQTPTNLRKLKDLLSKRDLEQLSAFAHKVKPTFAMVGFPDPGMVLETISELARTTSPESISMLEILMEGLEESANTGLEIIQSEKLRIAKTIEDQD